MTTDLMPPCQAARLLDKDLEEVLALAAAGVLDQRSVCGDHDSITVRSVRAYLADRAAAQGQA
jgi:hypothetical protein